MAKLSAYQLLIKARSLEKKGEHIEAEHLYKTILKTFPKNKRAQEGLAKLRKLSNINKSKKAPDEIIKHLLKIYNDGDIKVTYDQAILLTEKFPDEYMIWNILGATSKNLDRIDEALRAFTKVTQLNPLYADGFNNLGVALKGKGDFYEAIESFKKAIELKPDYANAHCNLGVVFQAQSRWMEAIECFKRAITSKPDYFDAFNNIGSCFKNLGFFEQAITYCQKAIELKPNFAPFHYNLGNAFKLQGNLTLAIRSYETAIALKPDYADAYNNIGTVLKAQNKITEAVSFYRKSIEIKPNFAIAFNNLAVIFNEQKKLEEALKYFKHAVHHKPDYESARAQKLHLQGQLCDWSDFQEERDLIPTLGVNEKDITPFSVLALEDAPERHRMRSELLARKKYPSTNLTIFTPPLAKPNRIRIGYFSADFHNFPGMYLMAGIFEKHDRSEFEISAFSYGPKKNDAMRKRIVNGVDKFIDISDLSLEQVKSCVLEQHIDIAIHRNGYTKNGKTELFSNRLAPIQISYLGYPGTLGANFIDYLVADKTIIPDEKQKYYSEKIIYLPHSYQPNDNKREISETTTVRADFGLPQKGFVLCCFNNTYKIMPEEFEIWMRIIQKVEGSVLWLLKSNQWAEKNLKIEAEKRGLSPDRLIFAEGLPHSEHLARHKHADLFIDTFHVNAHTTTSDALWTGLPVVTKLGEGFAARVAGSLLKAIGLPELITTNNQDYESLIMDLATDSAMLAEIKRKLLSNRLSSPLFDTEKYTRDLESGFIQAYQRHFNGKHPENIYV
jgi:protein O-GlcNAc transferase